MIRVLLLASFLVSCGKTVKRERVIYDPKPWAFEEPTEGYYQRHCGKYWFVYYENTLQGYHNLTHFLMYKTTLDNASKIVSTTCMEIN